MMKFFKNTKTFGKHPVRCQVSGVRCSDPVSGQLSGAPRRGFTRLELILTAAGILVLVGLLIFAVLDTRRRADDVETVALIRQVQFDLLLYRNAHASYPDSLETLYGGAPSGLGYEARPEGCAQDSERLCASYVLSFPLEGRTGALAGGACEASPDAIACTP